MSTRPAFENGLYRERLRESLTRPVRTGYSPGFGDTEDPQLPTCWMGNNPEETFGIPAEVAYLECYVRDRLPTCLRVWWSERFVDAIPDGADLTNIADQMMYWLLMDDNSPLNVDVDIAREIWKSFDQVALGNIYASRLAGATPSRQEVESLRELAIQDSVQQVRARTTPVIYASAAFELAALHVLRQGGPHLPAEALGSAVNAVEQLVRYSKDAWRAIPAAVVYDRGSGPRNLAANITVVIADHLTTLLRASTSPVPVG